LRKRWRGEKKADVYAASALKEDAFYEKEAARWGEDTGRQHMA